MRRRYIEPAQIPPWSSSAVGKVVLIPDAARLGKVIIAASRVYSGVLLAKKISIGPFERPRRGNSAIRIAVLIHEAARLVEVLGVAFSIVAESGVGSLLLRGRVWIQI